MPTIFHLKNYSDRCILKFNLETWKSLIHFFFLTPRTFMVSSIPWPFIFGWFLLQLPLAIISNSVEKSFGGRWGNVVVWASLILGQPLCILMYYHDYVIKHFGRDLLDSFSRLWKNYYGHLMSTLGRNESGPPFGEPRSASRHVVIPLASSHSRLHSWKCSFLPSFIIMNAYRFMLMGNLELQFCRTQETLEKRELL